METFTKSRRDRGFTLVELLVVVGIIALLIALIMPSMAKARQNAEAVVCQSNLRQNWLFMEMYAENNYGALYPSKLGANVPPEQRWTMLVFEPARPNPPTMICPTDQEIGMNDVDYRTNQFSDLEKHSYILNKHIIYNDMRLTNTYFSDIRKENVVLMGEKTTAYRDHYMEVDNYPDNTKTAANAAAPTTVPTSQSSAQTDYDRLVEPARHGPIYGSNLLFLDGHVDHKLPDPVPNAIDPWDPSGGRGTNPKG